MSSPVNIFWFRRDLRIHDNAGLFHALKDKNPVLPIFIFDRNILDELEDPTDRRLTFIHDALKDLQKQLLKLGSTLDTRYGKPIDIFKDLLNEYQVEKVFTNQDYEPYARERDSAISELLKQNGAELKSFKDQVIFEKNEVLKDDGKPYTIYTPYSKKMEIAANRFSFESLPE